MADTGTMMVSFPFVALLGFGCWGWACEKTYVHDDELMIECNDYEHNASMQYSMACRGALRVGVA